VSALLVVLGAVVGAPLRFLVASWLDDEWPVGTLLVNVAGSFVLGLCSGWSLDGGALALVGVGFCGALTTYSSFAVQTAELGPRRGLAYAVVTLGLALGACALGFVLAQA
jgi:CrcB protein